MENKVSSESLKSFCICGDLEQMKLADFELEESEAMSNSRTAEEIEKIKAELVEMKKEMEFMKEEIGQKDSKLTEQQEEISALENEIAITNEILSANSKIDEVKLLAKMELRKADRFFGFTIRGGSEFGTPLTISAIAENGPAAESPMQIGDQLMGIEGKSTEGMTHEEAVGLIKGKQQVRLVLKGYRNMNKTNKGQQCSSSRILILFLLANFATILLYHFIQFIYKSFT